MGAQNVVNMAILCLLLQLQTLSAHLDQYVTYNTSSMGTVDQVDIGLVVDFESWDGKIVKSSTDMAISDFYSEHHHYSTRLVLHSRDSNGEPLRALTAALDLVDSINVEAIIGAQTLYEANLLSEIGEKARIPIISFFQPNPQPSKMYPFFVEISDDKTSQVKPIISMIETYKWREAALVYDISNSQSEVISYLVDLLQKKNVDINNRSVILTNTTSDERLVEELCKVKNLHTKLLIVHLSHHLLSSLFLTAEKVGMMRKGFVWVMSTMSTNGLRLLDSSVIEKMQGDLVGFKNYIQDSWKLHYFTSRMRTELSLDGKVMEDHLRSLGKSAYDGIWCLAKAIERANVKVPLRKKKQITRLTSHTISINNSEVGPTQLLREIYRTKFHGLSGDLRFRIDGKLTLNKFETVKIMRNGERRVNFWNISTSTDETKKGRRLLSSRKCLDSITRPLPRGLAATTSVCMEIIHGNHKNGINRILNSGFSGLVKSVEVESEGNYKIGENCIYFVVAGVDNLNNNIIDDLFVLSLCPTPSKRMAAETYNSRICQVSFEFQYSVASSNYGSQYLNFTMPSIEIVRGAKMERRLLSSQKYFVGESNTTTEFVMTSRNAKLRIGIPVVKSGFNGLVDFIERDGKLKISGFCIDVFKAAVEKLNYTISYDFIPFMDQSKGMAGTYDDLIYQIYLGKFDAVVGDVTITPDRSKYVDFTIPFTDFGMGMIALDDSKSIWIFLKPLSSSLWIASAGFFILTGFVVWVIEHPINQEFQGSPSRQIGTVLWFTFSTLVYAHRERLVSNLSKFVVIVWLFVVFILTSCYTSTLSSMMTSKQLQLRNPRDSYIGYQMGSSTSETISNLNFKKFRMKPYSSPEDYANALLKGSKNGGVSAIIDEIPYIKIFLAQYADRNFYLAETFPTSNGFGFAFLQGSPMASDMSRAIAELREEGKLKSIEDKWFQAYKSNLIPNSFSTDYNPNALTLDNFRGLFSICGTSSALALLILLAFHIHKNCHLIGEFIVTSWKKFIEFIETSWNKFIEFVRAYGRT